MVALTLVTLCVLLLCGLIPVHGIEYDGSAETAAVREYFYVGGEYTNVTVSTD